MGVFGHTNRGVIGLCERISRGWAFSVTQTAAAADSLRAGGRRPATRIVADDILREMLLVGGPDEVGERLARLVDEHRPSAVGLALLQDDLIAA